MTEPAKQINAQEAIDLWLEVPRREISARGRRILEQGRTELVPFDDIELPLTQWGNEAHPLVLLMHGWGGNRAQLGAFVEPLLEAGFRAAAFDAPAHGDAPGTHTNVFQITTALWEVLKRIGQPQAVIAHSLGTMALNVALQRGLKPEKVVLSGAMRRLSDAFDPFIKLNNLSEDVHEKVDIAMRERFGEDAWEVTSLDLQLPKFDIPALLFHDKQDEVTPYVSSVAVARAWKSAKLITTDGLGHRLILHDPDVIRKTVEFLKE